MDMVLTEPLDGDVGDTPGAAFMKSNMLYRRVGMTGRDSARSGLESAASRFDPRAGSLDDNRLGDAGQLQHTVRSSVALAPMRMFSS